MAGLFLIDSEASVVVATTTTTANRIVAVAYHRAPAVILLRCLFGE